MTDFAMLVVTPEGEIREHVVPAGATKDATSTALLHAFYEQIGCSSLDMVRLTPEIDIWLDDEGALNGSPLNAAAGYIATRLGYDYQHFAGTAVFTGGNDDEGYTRPLSPAARAVLDALLVELPKRPIETHPATHHGCQTFTFLTQRWCITRALELIEANPDAAQFIEQAIITGLDQFLPLTEPEPGHIKLIAIEVDTDYAATTDLSEPILVARMLSNSGDDLGVMVIDGWHRIYRARSEGLSHLPAYLLSAETELAVRIPLGLRRR